MKERTRSVIKKSDKSFFMLLLVGWYRDYIVPSFKTKGRFLFS
ncbi:hypothetical protein MY7_2639 [Bacillus sp. 5B6]|nr:hypothetical protein MY7_2639 [Bacillus sp. 5B6]